MKCDRRWWNDGRVQLEGERAASHQGVLVATPYWVWRSLELQAWTGVESVILRRTRTAFRLCRDVTNPERAGNAETKRALPPRFAAGAKPSMLERILRLLRVAHE